MVYPQTRYTVDEIIRNYDTYNIKMLPEIENVVLDTLYNSNNSNAIKAAEKVFAANKSFKNKRLYILTLIHSYRLCPYSTGIMRLKEAIQLAKNAGEDQLYGLAHLYMGIVYRDASRMDSAMSTALIALDNLETYGSLRQQLDVRQLIADMHYYAGQYEDAEQYYLKIEKDEPDHNRTWRYPNIQNNLGLIKIQQKQYAAAEQYFNNSLRYYNSMYIIPGDSVKLPYIFRKLLEISVATGNTASVYRNYLTGVKLASDYGQESELAGMYALMGTFFLHLQKPDSARFYYEKASFLNNADTDSRTAVSIYEGLAKTYTLLKDFQTANKYLSLFVTTKNKMDSSLFYNRYLHNYAEYNYNKLATEVNYRKKENTYLWAGGFLVLILLLTMVSAYITLQRSTRKLIQKNIDLARLPVIGYSREALEIHPVSEDVPEEEAEQKNTELTAERIAEIIGSLEALMLKEKLYLKPEISLTEVAGILDTNRSYLSQAINSVFKINFNSYINDLRIKEAVRLITNQEHLLYTVDGLAEKSGFGNRVSFTSAFKKHTGVSPSVFIKNTKH